MIVPGVLEWTQYSWEHQPESPVPTERPYSMHYRVLQVCGLSIVATCLAGHVRQLPATNPTSSASSKLQARGLALYRSRKFLEAEQVFQQGFDEAMRRRDRANAVRLLNSLGSARFAMFQYRPAMQAFIEARKLALETGNRLALAAVSGNLSSLYFQQQEFNAGILSAEEALAALPQTGPTAPGPLLRTQAAILYSRQGRFDTAITLFGQAIQAAQARGDAQTECMIWDQVGYESLQRGRLDDAERDMLEAFRLRKLHKLADVQYSYYMLGLLRLAQGEARTAAVLLDQSLAREAEAAGALPLWLVYYERGLARLADNRATEALSDFQRSLDSARRLRLEVLPADSVWINTGVDQSRISSSLVRTASKLYYKTGDSAYARMAFEVFEQDRAASLRALIYSQDEWRKRVPAAYWEALAQLRAATGEQIHRNTPALQKETSDLRYRLTQMEAEAGLNLLPAASESESSSGSGLVERVRGYLREDEAFFSFSLDEPESLLWVVTRSDFRMYRLPARSHINALAEEFQRAVRRWLPQSVALGEQLYSDLFGAAEGQPQSKPRWILALDGSLFRLPLAALVAGRRLGRPEYLVERHLARIVPSALLFERADGNVWNGPFVGVGDPIYNLADQRRPPVTAVSLQREGFEMARLPGSGREIAACANAWGAGRPDAILLTGERASLQSLDLALARRPSVVHFATHFLKSAGDKPEALIALSLGSDHSPELFGPAEISRRRLDLGLVVLSGCTSAEAETLPAEGLMGMTRAWLAAGAHSVVASLWPTPDDQGKLFVSFYGHLAQLRRDASGGGAAEALRRAQLDMLASHSWHSSPGYWAAYTVAGKE